jgi:hypothetical protein
MEIKIVEKLDKDNDKHFDSRATPLSYRVSLQVRKNIIILKREYFRVGFGPGEGHNRYSFNSHQNSYAQLTYASFITRDVDNDDLKNKSELKLLKKFQKEALLSKSKVQKEIKRDILLANNNIKKYDEIFNFLDKYNRIEKIKKIKEIING